MNALAIDPSRRACGWCVAEDGQPIASGAWVPYSWHHIKACESARHAMMCGRAMLWLADMITEYEPSVIIIEAGGGRMTDRCSERLRGSLLGVAYVREVAVELIVPATWIAWAKRHADWTRETKSDEGDAQKLMAWWLAVRLPLIEREREARHEAVLAEAQELAGLKP